MLFDVIKGQFAVLDPSSLALEFDGLREELLGKIDQLVELLLPPLGAFDEVIERISLVRPSLLLGGVVDSLKPLDQLVAQLDPAALLTPLIEVAAGVREELPEVLARIEAALDEVLAAFPDGGTNSASLSLSA